MPNPLAVVTGAASGIGLALTLDLVGRSYDVIAIDKDPFPYDGMPNVMTARIDVTDQAAMHGFIDEIQPRRLDYLFANAGIGAPGSVMEATLQDWDRAFSVNTLGPLNTLRCWWPYLTEARGKAVVTVTAAALMTHQGAALYRASKVALLSILESFYYETRESGVSLHALCPGVVQTNIVVNTLKDKPGLEPDVFTKYLLDTMDASEPADRFAKRVLDELEGSPPFYWVTHPETFAAIRIRHRAVVNGSCPPAYVADSR